VVGGGERDRSCSTIWAAEAEELVLISPVFATLFGMLFSSECETVLVLLTLLSVSGLK